MKVLMVCLGNICRSPMAEGILRAKALERGIKIETDSAGTSDYHVGEAPDKRAQAKMKEKGIDISDLRARQFEPMDYAKFDHIFVMDASNYRNTLNVAHSPNHAKKVQMMLNISHPGSNKQVPDPYFGGDEGFEDVYHMLNEACETFLNRVSAKG